MRAATDSEEVRAVVTAAAAARKLPILLVDADRAGASADGGARWFGEAARGLGDDRALVVVRGRRAGDSVPDVAAALARR
ncbi:hypothetical protein [Amycolatopsis sp. NPDC050768]|uniref:hypothetical protein n=1 Tax=Amycolatopsis sp. NPDC050768 TaxID=3154839 RepID=UPI0033CA6427